MFKNFLKKNSCDGRYRSADVRFLKTCDNDCDFCIEKDGLDNQGLAPDLDIMALKLTLLDIDDVLILGGEPFLNPKRLLHYIECIEELRPSLKIYVTTSLPKVMMVDTVTTLAIMERISGLNVSIHSVDPDEHNRVLKAKSKHNRLEMLNWLNSSYAAKIRVNLNLIKGAIDTKEKLSNAVVVLHNLGCREIKINELQDSELAIHYEDLIGTKLSSPYFHGCQTKVTHLDDLFNGQGPDILLKRSCFIVDKTKFATIMDLAKVVLKKIYTTLFKPTSNHYVQYENGRIEKGWIKK